MKLFHGTPERNARCIEDEGFLGSEKTTFTGKGRGAGDVVFVTTDIAEAREYGDVVFEIRNVTMYRLPDAQSKNEGYVTLEDLNENGSWERVE